MKKILEKTIKNKLIFIFDFDGVIIDSMQLKGKVFSDIFTKENFYRKKIETYHLRNGSKNRTLKIKYIANKILKLNIKNKDEFYGEKLEKFDKIYNKNLNKIKLISGIKKYLKKIKKDNNKKIFIVTAAPKEEVIKILKINNIFAFFNDIYDVNIEKEKAILKIIKKYSDIDLYKFIFFGDSPKDFIASKKNKIDFCSLLTNKLSPLKNKKTFAKIYDFK